MTSRRKPNPNMARSSLSTARGSHRELIHLAQGDSKGRLTGTIAEFHRLARRELNADELQIIPPRLVVSATTPAADLQHTMLRIVCRFGHHSASRTQAVIETVVAREFREISGRNFNVPKFSRINRENHFRTGSVTPNPVLFEKLRNTCCLPLAWEREGFREVGRIPTIERPCLHRTPRPAPQSPTCGKPLAIQRREWPA